MIRRRSNPDFRPVILSEANFGGLPESAWMFDEANGTTIIDLMVAAKGSGNNGTATSCTLDQRPGPINRSNAGAISFDGSASRIVVANESNFDIERTQAFTIEAFINPSFVRSAFAGNAIFSKLDSASPNSGFEFEVLYTAAILSPNNKALLSVNMVNNFGTGNRIGFQGSTDLTNGTWWHVALVSTGSSTAAGVSLYVNGVAESKNGITDALSGSMLNNISPCIGMRNASGEKFKGQMGGVGALYKYAMAVDRLKYHTLAGLNGLNRR